MYWNYENRIIRRGQCRRGAGHGLGEGGHEVFFGVQDPAAKDTLALVLRCGPQAKVGTLQEAAAFGDVIVIALPWTVAYDALPNLKLSGKVVIDCSNPPAVLPGDANSGTEALAAVTPGAKFAKAFNITGSNNMEKPLYADGPLAFTVARILTR